MYEKKKYNNHLEEPKHSYDKKTFSQSWNTGIKNETNLQGIVNEQYDGEVNGKGCMWGSIMGVKQRGLGMMEGGRRNRGGYIF